MFHTQAALRPEDVIFGQYREAGVLLWRGFTFQQVCLIYLAGFIYSFIYFIIYLFGVDLNLFLSDFGLFRFGFG